MSWRVARSDAFGGASFSTTRLRIPWAPSDGLFVYDTFGGAAPIELPLPEELVARGTFPYVILSCHDLDAAFLAQRWFDRPITSWHLLAHVQVGRTTVCLTTRSTATTLSGAGLVEAERLVNDAPDLWAQVALDAQPVLGVRVTRGAGTYPLHLALDETGTPVGWVLGLGVAETT
jgi:hypothetical protein